MPVVIALMNDINPTAWMIDTTTSEVVEKREVRRIRANRIDDLRSLANDLRKTVASDVLGVVCLKISLRQDLFEEAKLHFAEIGLGEFRLMSHLQAAVIHEANSPKVLKSENLIVFDKWGFSFWNFTDENKMEFVRFMEVAQSAVNNFLRNLPVEQNREDRFRLCCQDENETKMCRMRKSLKVYALQLFGTTPQVAITVGNCLQAPLELFVDGDLVFKVPWCVEFPFRWQSRVYRFRNEIVVRDNERKSSKVKCNQSFNIVLTIAENLIPEWEVYPINESELALMIYDKEKLQLEEEQSIFKRLLRWFVRCFVV